ncbi:MAG: FAD-binding oxidoreductase [Vulcanimicrobiaceae bacterium]
MLRERLVDALGADAVKTSPEDLAAYAFDAYSESAPPDAVVLPTSSRQVCATVAIARDCGVPVVGRGAGTGLCGGAVPTAGGIVVSFARMNRLLQLDLPNRRARVQPGLINLALSEAVAGAGLFYAPDPASQRASTLGGNIATNAGGPHCLGYGVTANHVLELEVVDDRGEVFSCSIDDVGYDLTGVLVGSEGTLGLVTSAWVRLLRMPESVRVWLAGFADIESASAAVSQTIAAGIVPSAMEIMDAVITQAVEAAFHAGYPTDVGAILLIENAGFEEDMQAGEAAISRICRDAGALFWRSAKSTAERAALWAGRKGAAAATGRIAPNYYTQDVCVPRSKLPQAIAVVREAAAGHGVTVGNVFHAGDGNLHPLLMYDKRDRKQVAGVIGAGNVILDAAIALGGTISGEHGIGHEKREAMTRVYTTEDLATMAKVREVFDPARSLNPEKIFPRGVGCPEVR